MYIRGRDYQMINMLHINCWYLLEICIISLKHVPTGVQGKVKNAGLP